MVTWVRYFAEKLFSEQQEILVQVKHCNPQEYCMYFKDFNVQSWGKRSAASGKRISKSAANAVNSIPEQRRGEAIGLPDRFEGAA